MDYEVEAKKALSDSHLALVSAHQAYEEGHTHHYISLLEMALDSAKRGTDYLNKAMFSRLSSRDAAKRITNDLSKIFDKGRI